MNYIKENIAEFEICGIIKWHELGYTGNGIKIANMENCNPSLSIFDGKIKDPYSVGSDKYSNTHANKTTDILHQVAPDSNIYILPTGARYSMGELSGDLVEITYPFIEKNIHLVNASLGGKDREEENKFIQGAKKNGVTFVTSAGNSDKGLSGYARSGEWISVAALGYHDKKDEIFLKDYSSRGEELFASGFSGLYVHDARKGYEGRVFRQEGTSFSSPKVCGMLALVQQFFLEKVGRNLYQNEIELFMKDNVKDLGIEGHDKEYGHGLFILPDPETIQIERYLLREADTMSANKPNKIIIHHSATDDTNAKNFDGIKNHHINVNGWSDIGYHYVVEKVNGKYVTIKGRQEERAGVHCPGQNSQSIGICLVGDFRQGNPPKEQLEETAKLIKDIRSRHGELPLYKHSDFRPTECPVFDLELIIDLMEADNNMSWEEKQGLEYLDNLVKKGIIESPDYWKEKMLEPMPVWAILSLIDRITDK